MSNSFERLKTALVDRYAIEREIGAGGIATVYLAEDLRHHRQVAVKVLRPDLAAALGSERFIREIDSETLLILAAQCALRSRRYSYWLRNVEANAPGGECVCRVVCDDLWLRGRHGLLGSQSCRPVFDSWVRRLGRSPLLRLAPDPAGLHGRRITSP